MKHIIAFTIVLLSLAALSPLKAQDNYPLVEDGKVWVVTRTVSYSAYEIKGDTLCRGRNWKRLYYNEFRKTNGIMEEWGLSFTFLIREEEGRIYTIAPHWEESKTDSVGRLLIDFNVQVGDTLVDICKGLGFKGFYTNNNRPIVTSIGEREVVGIKRKEISLTYEELALGNPNAQISWVDGIGIFPNDPFSNYEDTGWGWHDELLLCMKGEEVLYCPTESGYELAKEVLQALGYPLSINAITTTATHNDALYDLQGRKVRGVPGGGGVYISKGRKVLKSSTQ